MGRERRWSRLQRAREADRIRLWFRGLVGQRHLEVFEVGAGQEEPRENRRESARFSDRHPERTRAMDQTAFRYQPTCSAQRCQSAAVFKVAAPWSNGTSRELKNYGLACEAHRDSLLALAQLHRQGLKLAEGETIGPLGLYELAAGKRDIELNRLPDH